MINKYKRIYKEKSYFCILDDNRPKKVITNKEFILVNNNNLLSKA